MDVNNKGKFELNVENEQYRKYAKKINERC